MQLKAEEVKEVVRSVRDPELGRTLDELNAVGQVQVDGEVVAVELVFPTPAYPEPERIAEAVRQAVRQKWPDVSKVEVTWKAVVRGKMSGGKIGLRVKNVLAVGSGKGGVGKSTVAAALAFGFKQFGAQVGLMDADVYGPSIPHLVGVHEQPAITEYRAEDGRLVQKIRPVDCDGMKLLSIGLMIREDQPVIWRGPMLHGALTQFLKDADWGELDYLVVDLPPGTGDVAITLSQLVSLAGAVVVCTPQKIALLDAVKAVAMFRQVNIPVLGVVENMSGDVFGRGGAREKAKELGVPFLGEIPSLPEIRVKGDEGRIADLFAEDCPARQPLLHVCQQVALQVANQVLGTGELPQLEVLE